MSQSSRETIQQVWGGRLRVSEAKKESIIASALKLFEEKGFHATKVSDIVKDAGIAQGTFYLYFKSKEDLFRSIAETCMQEIVQALDDVPPYCDPGTMRLVIRRTVTICYQNRTILCILNLHGAASPEIADISEQYYERMAESIVRLLKQAGAYPGYTDEQLEMTAYGLIGMVEMASYQWFVVKGHGTEYIDPLTDALVGIHSNCPADSEAGGDEA